jgi:hypothetical protein
VDPYRIAAVLKVGGCNALGFELSAYGFFDSTSDAGVVQQKVINECKRWADACWRNGLYFLPQILNCNDVGKGVITRIWANNPSVWADFTRRVRQAIGDQGVLFQPSLEDEDKHQSVVGAITAAWPGPPKIYNRGSTPKKLPPGWDFLDVHPHKVTDSWPAGHTTIVQTDSPIGGQLRAGAGPDQFNPKLIEEYARKVLSSGSGFVHFTFSTDNQKNIEDCAAAIGRAL